MDLTPLGAAIIGGAIASIIPTIQYIFERRRDWHMSRETLIQHLTNLYEESDNLACNPDSHNHSAFQFIFVRESIFFQHMSKRYFSKQKVLNQIGNELKHAYKDFLLEPENEEILVLSGASHPSYKKFVDDLRSCVTQKTEKVLDA